MAPPALSSWVSVVNTRYRSRPGDPATARNAEIVANMPRRLPNQRCSVPKGGYISRSFPQ